jgi:hypothetical protein
MHPEIIASASAHSNSEEVAAALVSKAAYDAVWAQNALLLAEIERVRAQAADAQALQSQLGQAHEALLAQADAEAIRATAQRYDLILRERYTPDPIPACRVCGGPLSLCSFGGGPTIYGCSEWEDDPEDPKRMRPKADRHPADEHYVQSRHMVYRDGDRQVIELLDALLTIHPGTPLADEVRAARALTAQGKKLADAVQGYFNTIGTSTIDRRPERHEIYQMAEMLADYGVIEQQVKVGQVFCA